MGDGTKIFLPEYEAGLMECLGNPELAVALRNDRPVLVYVDREGIAEIGEI